MPQKYTNTGEMSWSSGLTTLYRKKPKTQNIMFLYCKAADSPHKGPVIPKAFPWHGVNMLWPSPYQYKLHKWVTEKCGFKSFLFWLPCTIDVLGTLTMALSSWTIRILLCMGLANERRRYSVTSSLIGWAHTLNNGKKYKDSICLDTRDHHNNVNP